jgi:hypothetical protein
VFQRFVHSSPPNLSSARCMYKTVISRKRRVAVSPKVLCNAVIKLNHRLHPLQRFHLYFYLNRLTYPVSGSLDDCVEKDGTFYLSRDAT